MQLENLARLRQMAYRLFSSTLLYPDESRLRAITATAVALSKDSHFTDRFTFSQRWQHFLASLTKPSEKHILEEEYIRVFVHSPEGVACLPYESVYLDPARQAAGWILATLEREYTIAGLALSPSLKEPPDHVAVELEFMAFMCGQEADAWSQRAMIEGIQTLECQTAFLSAHLTRWLPDWARQVVIADGGGIYSIAAETSYAFVSHDRDLVGILLDKFGKRHGFVNSDD